MRRNNPGAARREDRRLWINTTWAVLLALWLATPLCANGDSDGGTVEHIVIVWLKEPGNEAARERVLENSQRLAAIPGVLSLKSGRAIISDRPVVDSSFDVALVITLADAAAMQDYLAHPVHIQLVEETLKPLVERIQVYDFSHR